MRDLCSNNSYMKSNNYAVSSILAANIKKKRSEMRLTQAQLAEKIGVSVRHLSDIERSDSFPSPSVIEALASAFEIPSYTLFLPDEEARKEILITSDMKEMLDDEIYKAIEKVIKNTK